LGRREDADSEASAETDDGAPDEGSEPENKMILGLTLTPLTDALREELGADATMEGLAVTEVDEASEAYEKGLRSGDIITEAGQQKVSAIDDLEARVKAAKDGGRKSLLLLVRRAGDPRFVALSLGD
jgi:serine protease Do